MFKSKDKKMLVMLVSIAMVFSALAVISFEAQPTYAVATQTFGHHNGNVVYVNNAVPIGTDTGFSSPGYNTISSALANAQPGETIMVAPGTYNEAIVISTPDIKIIGSGIGQTIIEPLSASDFTTTTDIDDGSYADAIVLITSQGSGSAVEQLTVDGSAAAPSVFPLQYYGVYFQDASGMLRSTAINNIIYPSDLGKQHIGAVLVNNGYYYANLNVATQINVTIVDNIITNYGKNGITANDPGVFAMIRGNKVTGYGPDPDNAQNGIQIGFGASGIVVGNRVSGNSYSNPSNTENYLTASYMAGGIIVYDSNATIIGNTLEGNDVGIWIANYGGHDLPVVVAKNKIKDSYGYGIVFDSDNGTATKNFISDSPVGIMATTYMNYNTVVRAHNNEFNDVSVDYQTLEPNPPYYATIIVGQND